MSNSELGTRNSLVNIDQFNYRLPESLIAQYPVEPRDASRLMVLHRQTGVIEHRYFKDIVDYLRPSDALVLNRTRVMQARLRGVREKTGGQVEVVLIREDESGRWEAMLRPGARLGAGAGSWASRNRHPCRLGWRPRRAGHANAREKR